MEAGTCRPRSRRTAARAKPGLGGRTAISRPPRKSGGSCGASGAEPLAEHDVEAGRERVRLGVGGRLQGDGDERSRVAEIAIEEIALVARLAGEIHLGDQAPAAGRRDGKVNVRRATRIRHWLDRAEAVGT